MVKIKLIGFLIIFFFFFFILMPFSIPFLIYYLGLSNVGGINLN